MSLPEGGESSDRAKEKNVRESRMRESFSFYKNQEMPQLLGHMGSRKFEQKSPKGSIRFVSWSVEAVFCLFAF